MKQPRESFETGTVATGDTPLAVGAEESGITIDNEWRLPWRSEAEKELEEANAAIAALAKQGAISIGQKGVDMQKVALGVGVLGAAATAAVAYKKGWFKNLI